MEKSTKRGVGFMALLFIVFLVLRLTKVISWSWWWITAPLWIPVAMGFIMVMVFAFTAIRNARKNRKLFR